MKKFRGKYRIESVRMPGWDYALGGKYFVTINTQKRICRFGDVVDGEMQLNEMGKIVRKHWMEIPSCFANTYLDEFQIMPDHVHGIVVMKRLVCGDDTGSRLYTPAITAATVTPVNPQMARISPKSGSLSVIIGGWKSKCTKEFRETGCTWHGWQSRFHDHIIRNDGELQRIRQYIRNNPENWRDDR